MIVSALSFLQVQWSRLTAACKRCRRNYVTPLALQGGRDMVLLRAGGWVDDLPQIPEDSITCRYLAEENNIVFIDSTNLRLRRFPWLSVTDASHDMTDFFTDLRITADRELLHEEIMSLYAHQCQRFPVAPIQITTRDGDEIELDAEFQEVAGLSVLSEDDVSGNTLSEDVSGGIFSEDDVSGNTLSEDVSGDIIIPGVQNYEYPALNFIK